MAAEPSASGLRTSDFDYQLPPELIAQTPIEPRDASRLLVLDRAVGSLAHARFSEIGQFLRSGDLLVLNNSRVIAARLTGERVPGGGRVEALLLRERENHLWEALLRPGKRTRPGQALRFHCDGQMLASRVEGWLEDGICLLAFEPGVRPETLGVVPLPPYIQAPLADPERYQTVYSGPAGSAAAPTAGLHFTPRLLDELRAAGVEIVFLTLHVGPGTFRPVHVEDPKQHPMHAEYYFVSPEVAAALNRARLSGRRIIAGGTTSVRTLEQIAIEAGAGEVQPGEGWTSLLILPGHRFRLVDALITNFHLPRSTLMMLVSALAGREQILGAYREAIRLGYRFFSFGDAMLIL